MLMKATNFDWARAGRVIALAPLMLTLALLCGCAAGGGKRLHATPKWTRFEHTLISATDYTNAVQEVAVKVTFTSPSGVARVVDGFWDGGRTWRVRTLPNEMGLWKFTTSCSDPRNRGLHRRRGTFLCTAALDRTFLQQHGPVQVSRDGRRLMHEDGTPFFWLGDTAWNGPLLSRAEDWDQYAILRSMQGYSVVQWVTTQWRAAPTGDALGMKAYTGTERIDLNPAFFQRLDARAEALTRAGLVNAPVLLWAINGGSNPGINPGVSLPEDQAILLARYMVARWGADPCVWILAGDGNYQGAQAEKWKRIGRAVFGDQVHAPVLMHPGGMQWIYNEFKDEPWMDILGYQSGHGDDDATLKWLWSGPPAQDWKQAPAKPFINLEPPYEDHIAYQSKQRISAQTTRRAVWWSLLVSPTAGVTYGGHGIWGWDDGTKEPTDHAGTGVPKPWNKALFLPGGQQMSHVAALMRFVGFEQLAPAPELLAKQPGNEAASRFIAAAASPAKDLAVIYVPEDRQLVLNRQALPQQPVMRWFNPRSGEWQDAAAVAENQQLTCTTPAEGDWVMVIKGRP